MEPALSKGYELPLAAEAEQEGSSAGADGADVPGSQPSPAAATDCPMPPPLTILH